MTILTVNTKRLFSLCSCQNVVQLRIKLLNITVNLFLKVHSPRWLEVKAVWCTSRGERMTSRTFLSSPPVSLVHNWLRPFRCVLLSCRPPTPVCIYTVPSRCAGIRQVMFTPTDTSSTPPPTSTHTRTDAYPSPGSDKLFTPQTPGTKGQADLYPPHSAHSQCIAGSRITAGCFSFAISEFGLWTIDSRNEVNVDSLMAKPAGLHLLMVLVVWVSVTNRLFLTIYCRHVHMHTQFYWRVTRKSLSVLVSIWQVQEWKAEDVGCMTKIKWEGVIRLSQLTCFVHNAGTRKLCSWHEKKRRSTQLTFVYACIPPPLWELWP